MNANKLETIGAQIRSTRNSMCAALFLLIAAICVAVIIAHFGPMDWRFGLWMIYTAIPLVVLVANAFYYTDLLIDRFELTVRIPADDIIGVGGWEPDDLVIEPVYEDDEEED